MSWFDTAGFASLAKSALNTAQKTIDKALDIKDERAGALEKANYHRKDDDSFFAAFGLGAKDNLSPLKKSAIPSSSSDLSTTINTSSKDNSSFWGDTWGSFFEARGNSSKAELTSSVTSDNNCKSSEQSAANSPSPSRVAVLSQPQQAAFFPTDDADSSVSDNADTKTPDVTLESKVVHSLTSQPISTSENTSVKPLNQGGYGTLEGNLNSSTILVDLTSKSGDNYKEVNANFIVSDGTNELMQKAAFPNSTGQLSDCMDLNKFSQQLNTENSLLVDKTNVLDDFKTEVLDENIPGVMSTDQTTLGNQLLVVVDKEPDALILYSDKKCGHSSQYYEHIGSDFCVVDSSGEKNSSEDLMQKSLELIEPFDHEILNSKQLEAEASNPNVEGSIISNLEGWEWKSLQQDAQKNELLDSHLLDNNEDTSHGKNSNFSDSSKETYSSPDSIIQISDGENISSPQQLDPSLELGVMINLSLAHMGGGSSITGDKWLSESGSAVFCEELTCEEMLSEHPRDNQNTSHKDDEETVEVRECEVKSSDSGGSQGTSSSSSFVKCSVEEADSSYSHRDQSPVSGTASERSDTTKFESEQNSGHTSGDENETATSSDIEIISPPNGENGDRQATSPLKHIWIPRPHRSRRSESPASDCNKDNIMPVVREVEEDSDHSLNVRIYAGCSRSSSDPVEDLLKSIQHGDFEKLLQRQNEIQEILEARERRVFELSKENAELVETNVKFQTQIKQLEATHAKESQGVSDLTQEFTQRLANLESKLHQACKERDSLKKQLQTAQQQAVSRESLIEIESIMKEKDQQISELKEEGEKLSKKELHHTTIIKKLRAKEEETDNALKSLKEKLEEQSKELERLRKSLGAKDEQEKKHIDAIHQLTSTVQTQEKEIATLKSEVEDANEKARGLKKALDNSYKEMTELHKVNAEKESYVQEFALSVKVAAQEELRQGVEQTRSKALKEKEILLSQLEDLRASLSKMEDQSRRREEMLRHDIGNLQQRLQESEGRNEELTRNVSAATRPLLRQIENLQATFSVQSSSWEKVEKNLTDRLSETQTQLSLSVEKERAAKEKCLELNSRVTTMETKNSSLSHDKTRLISQLEMLQMQLTVLEESKKGEHLSVETVKQTLLEEMNTLKRDKEALTLQVQLNQEQLDIERQKVQELQEHLKKEKKLVATESSSNPSPTVSRISSVSEGMNWLQDDHSEPALGLSAATYNRPSLYNSVRNGNAATLLEGLQSQLKLREGEISQLHSEISQLERVKESMAQELVTLTGQIDELEQELADLRNTKESFKDMEQKYNTLLQMYGEKVEEAEELRLDLDDVKSLYKTQIEELLRKP